jgi:hypothetical protein
MALVVLYLTTHLVRYAEVIFQKLWLHLCGTGQLSLVLFESLLGMEPIILSIPYLGRTSRIHPFSRPN